MCMLWYSLFWKGLFTFFIEVKALLSLCYMLYNIRLKIKFLYI